MLPARVPVLRLSRAQKPSAIQQRAIKPMTLGRDIIAQAQSGTGKTATFAVGILQMLDPNVQDCQALILAPTRELAQQIVKVIVAISDFMSVRVHACVGGTGENCAGGSGEKAESAGSDSAGQNAPRPAGVAAARPLSSSITRVAARG